MSFNGAEVWAEWRRITRFLEGARLALARETSLLSSLSISPKSTISVSTGQGTYKVDLGGHLEAVADEEMLFSSVLLHSYALTESTAAAKLAASTRSFQGIEDWGERLLRAEGSSWEKVTDGLAGAVEVAVARNAIAHGHRSVDGQGCKRLRKAGSSSWAEGDPIALDYEALQTYRARLRSLLRMGGVRG